MKNVAVVAASFLLSISVESAFLDATFEVYYTAALASTVVVIYLCNRLHTTYLAIYALLQYIQGCFYLAILFGHFESVAPIVWDYPINFSILLLSYELAIIVNGVINAGFTRNRMRSGVGIVGDDS